MDWLELKEWKHGDTPQLDHVMYTRTSEVKPGWFALLGCATNDDTATLCPVNHGIPRSTVITDVLNNSYDDIAKLPVNPLAKIDNDLPHILFYDWVSTSMILYFDF